MTISVEKTTEH